MTKLILLFIIPTILLPQSYNWNETGTLNNVRVGHSMVKLSNGNILVSGNEFYDTEEINKSCEIFDIQNNTWKHTASLNYEKKIHHTVLLNNGEVLAFGGISNNQCEIFNVEQETWRVTAPRPTLRNFGGDTFEKLNNGNI